MITRRLATIALAHGTPLLMMACTGEATEPGRGANHPANPNAPEAPFTAGASTPPSVPRAPGTRPDVAPAPTHSHEMHPKAPAETK